MIRTPAATSPSAAACAASTGTASTPTMMFFSRTCSSRRSNAKHSTPPNRCPTLSPSVSKRPTMLKPWSSKMSDAAIACPRRPAPRIAMLCCPAIRTSTL
jgi:hypothetical protein